MKTTFYLAIVIVISFIAITPNKPKDYPPKSVVKLHEAIVFEENKINHLIDKIDYQYKKDSLQIKLIKNEQSQRN